MDYVMKLISEYINYFLVAKVLLQTIVCRYDKLTSCMYFNGSKFNSILYSLCPYTSHGSSDAYRDMTIISKEHARTTHIREKGSIT